MTQLYTIEIIISLMGYYNPFLNKNLLNVERIAYPNCCGMHCNCLKMYNHLGHLAEYLQDSLHLVAFLWATFY